MELTVNHKVISINQKMAIYYTSSSSSDFDTMLLTIKHAQVLTLADELFRSVPVVLHFLVLASNFRFKLIYVV